MAALTQDIKPSVQQDAQLHAYAASGETIYVGAMVMLGADGFLYRAAASLEGGIVCGYAVTKVENSTGGSLSGELVRVETDKPFNIAGLNKVGGSALTQATGRGRLAYVVDDQTVALEPDDDLLGAVVAGEISNVKANGLCAVRPIWRRNARSKVVSVRLVDLTGTGDPKATLVLPRKIRLVSAIMTVHAITDNNTVVSLDTKAAAAVGKITITGAAAAYDTAVAPTLANNEIDGITDGLIVTMDATNTNTQAIDADLVLEYTEL